jgi:integrase
MAYIHRRGKAFRVGFTLNGKKKFKQFKSHRLAKRFSEGLDAYRETQAGTGSLTVEQACRAWLTACAAGRDGNYALEPETIKTYTGYVNNYIVPTFQKTKIRDVDRLAVRAFRDDLLADRQIARITAKKILGALKSTISHALDTGEVTADVGARVTIKLGGRHARELEPPKKTAFKLILDLAAQKFQRALDGGGVQDIPWLRYYPMLLVLCYCGLRLSEVRGLPLAALDFEEGKVRVYQRADRAGRIGPPKSVQGRREIFMPTIVQEALKIWIERAKITTDNHLVFASYADPTKPMSPENIRKRMWVPLLCALKLPDQNLHVTRHFYASRRIELGDSLKELAEVMGHADPAFTLRVYGHLFKDLKNEKRRKSRAQELVL